MKHNLDDQDKVQCFNQLRGSIPTITLLQEIFDYTEEEARSLMQKLDEENNPDEDYRPRRRVRRY